MYFVRSKSLAAVDQVAVVQVLQKAAPNAYIDAGRPAYAPIIRSEMVLFLARTQVDRFAWRNAQPKSDTPEMVCASFSLLLWGLIEQQRLAEHVAAPFAACRVRFLRHSSCGFLSQDGLFLLIEPQNDQIMTVDGYRFDHPGEEIQHITLL